MRIRVTGATHARSMSDTLKRVGWQGRAIARLPALLMGIAIAGLWIYGPVAQFSSYHDFADQRRLWGVPHALNVLSNLGFALVGLWGLYRTEWMRALPGLARGAHGYRLFLVSLVLTAFGSGYYHLDPNDARLFWDRVPIALASAGLLAAVHAETSPRTPPRDFTWALAAAGVASVVWWTWTARRGTGDLGPYLLMNLMPLVLIPLWQAIHGSPRADRTSFLVAIALYAAAKLAELQDHQIQTLLGVISGHTLKHLLATAAGAVITLRLVKRVEQVEPALPLGLRSNPIGGNH